MSVEEHYEDNTETNPEQYADILELVSSVRGIVVFRGDGIQDIDRTLAQRYDVLQTKLEENPELQEAYKLRNEMIFKNLRIAAGLDVKAKDDDTVTQGMIQSDFYDLYPSERQRDLALHIRHHLKYGSQYLYARCNVVGEKSNNSFLPIQIDNQKQLKLAELPSDEYAKAINYIVIVGTLIADVNEYFSFYNGIARVEAMDRFTYNGRMKMEAFFLMAPHLDMDLPDTEADEQATFFEDFNKVLMHFKQVIVSYLSQLAGKSKKRKNDSKTRNNLADETLNDDAVSFGELLDEKYKDKNRT